MKGAVLELIGEPLSIVDLEIPALEPGQVLVKILCTGICGSQLQEIDGLKGDPAHCPHLLGHEGCGIVEEVGLGVFSVKKGDKVVMHWRKGAGMDVVGAIYQPGDNGEHTYYWLITSGPITTFSEYSIVSENRVTRIDPDVPNDLACLLGCALSTALAVVENEAKPKQGDRVLVVGCGGVGLAMILASKMLTQFVGGIDSFESKRYLVESLGAQFGVFVTSKVDFDVIIDTTGKYKAPFCDRYISLQKGGSEGGGFQPDKDIPRYVEMWRQGKLNDYPKLITHRISLDEINQGISLMRDGKAGRVLIEM